MLLLLVVCTHYGARGMVCRKEKIGGVHLGIWLFVADFEIFEREWAAVLRS